MAPAISSYPCTKRLVSCSTLGARTPSPPPTNHQSYLIHKKNRKSPTACSTAPATCQEEAAPWWAGSKWQLRSKNPVAAPLPTSCTGKRELKKSFVPSRGKRKSLGAHGASCCPLHCKQRAWRSAGSTSLSCAVSQISSSLRPFLVQMS